jgi:hypothetical protein
MAMLTPYESGSGVVDERRYSRMIQVYTQPVRPVKRSEHGIVEAL